MLVLGHRGKLENWAASRPATVPWNLIFACVWRCCIVPVTIAEVAHLAHHADRQWFAGRPAHDWLAANPWTAAAFGEEAAVWKQVGQEYLVKSETGEENG